MQTAPVFEQDQLSQMMDKLKVTAVKMGEEREKKVLQEKNDSSGAEECKQITSVKEEPEGIKQAAVTFEDENTTRIEDKI